MKVGMAAVSTAVLAFLILPILALVPMSFSGTRWLAFPPSDLSLRWYAGFFGDPDWLEATWTSLRVATGTMAVACGLGTLAGVALGRGRFPGRELVRGLIISPLIVPVMVMAIAFYDLFARFRLVGTLSALVLAHVVLAVPYVVITVEAATRTVDVRLERAARVLGANAWQALRRVTLPLIRAGVLAGALFAFIVSLDEVVVAIFLSGTSAVTLPKLMWDSITQDELNPVVTAVASLQIAMALLVFGATEILRRQGGRVAFATAAGVGEGGERWAAPIRVAPLGTPGTAAEIRGGASRLRLVGVVKRFGAVVAVDGVSFDVEPGEFLTLLGPSGSGKSTLLNLIAGFESPSAGEILIGATPITRKPPNRRDIGMVFQDYALFPHMTVFENVAFALRVRRTPAREVRPRVEEMLEVVRLGGLGGRRPAELSGGQQQRVALARALVFQPPLLLMDEPLGALDRNLRASMQEELRQLHRRFGITVLFVTHDQEEAMALSDRIAVIDHGRLQQVGRPDELYEAPANAFVAGFVGESNLLPCRITAERNGEVAVLTDGGSAFVARRGRERPGGEAYLMIRPESLRLEADGAGGPGTVRGVVEEAVYLGGFRRYTVRINSREVLIARLPNQPDTRRLGMGSPVQVSWEPQDLRLL